MNATSAACCGDDDDNEDDEDGEAADMEGTPIQPLMKQLFCFLQKACSLIYVVLNAVFRVRGKWPVGNR